MDVGLGIKSKAHLLSPFFLTHFQGPRPISNLHPLSKPIIIVIIIVIIIINYHYHYYYYYCYYHY